MTEGCEKKAYPGKTSAERTRKAMKGFVYDSRGLHTYYCNECRAWHIGHARASNRLRA